jgi:hypothetical protein
MTYDMIKQNYDRKLWSITMLKKIVAKGPQFLTPEQFEEITGEVYTV